MYRQIYPFAPGQNLLKNCQVLCRKKFTCTMFSEICTICYALALTYFGIWMHEKFPPTCLIQAYLVIIIKLLKIIEKIYIYCYGLYGRGLRLRSPAVGPFCPYSSDMWTYIQTLEYQLCSSITSYSLRMEDFIKMKMSYNLIWNNISLCVQDLFIA